jgi:hypothetical protein
VVLAADRALGHLETTMDNWPAAIAVASIAFACAIYYTVSAWFTHRERMAKIQQGINPDLPAEKDASK